jgi:hypothetical protein
LTALLIVPSLALGTTVEAPLEPLPVERTFTTKEEINVLIDEKAKEYGVSSWTMKYIVSHESHYNVVALGDKGFICPKTGQIAPSRGLVQINRCYWPNEYKLAYDPEFAIDFLARQLKKGRCDYWSTCPY